MVGMRESFVAYVASGFLSVRAQRSVCHPNRSLNGDLGRNADE
jgi:hypothetical protein